MPDPSLHEPDLKKGPAADPHSDPHGDPHGDPHPDAHPGQPQDGTLGGYLSFHGRPPAYEGPDGHPYTVSLEIEKTGNLRAPYAAYLVFPRWAQTGAGIVGHLETPTLFEARSVAEAEEQLGTLSLLEVQALLLERLRVETAREGDLHGTEGPAESDVPDEAP